MKSPVSLCLPILACLAVALLSGCTGGSSVVAARVQTAKRIGVVSLLGDEANAHTGGMTAFEVRSRNGNAADWRVDAAISDAVVQNVRARTPGAQVVALQGERAGIRPPAPPHLSLLPGQASGGGTATLEEDARKLAARDKLDMVVLVFPSEAPASNNGVPRAPGYGVTTLNLFGIHRSEARIYVNYGVGVFDGATGQRLAVKFGSRMNGTPNDGVEVPGRATLPEYTPYQREILAALIRQTAVKEVTDNLRDLGLAP